MENGEVKSMVVKIAAGSKKWRADNIIYTVIPRIFCVINKINELSENAHYFNDFNCNISDITIPQELGFLIYPASIRLDPNNLLTENILYKPKYIVKGYTLKDNVYKENDNELKLDDNYSLVDWESDCAAFRSIFKKDAKSDLINMETLRKKLSLFDVSNRLAYFENNNFHVSMLTNDLQWPVFIKESVAKGLFKDYWFNSDIKEFCNQYAKFLIF